MVVGSGGETEKQDGRHQNTLYTPWIVENLKKDEQWSNEGTTYNQYNGGRTYKEHEESVQ